jgi:lipopolysaccharide biosynthesis glycosyltransferase
MNATYTIAIDAPGRNDFARQAALMVKSMRNLSKFQGDIFVFSNTPKVACTAPYTHIPVELPPGQDQRKWSTTFRFNLMETHSDILMGYDKLLFIDTDVIVQKPIAWFDYDEELIYTCAPRRKSYSGMWYGANFTTSHRATARGLPGATAGHVITSKDCRQRLYNAWRDCHDNAPRNTSLRHTDQSALNRVIHDTLTSTGEYDAKCTLKMAPMWDVVYYKTHKKYTTLDQMNEATIVHYNGYSTQEARLKAMQGDYLRQDWSMVLPL